MRPANRLRTRMMIKTLAGDLSDWDRGRDGSATPPVPSAAAPDDYEALLSHPAGCIFLHAIAEVFCNG